MAKSIQEAMQAALKQQQHRDGTTGASPATATSGDSQSVVERLVNAANPKGKGGQKLVRVTYGPSSEKRSSRRQEVRKPNQPDIIFPSLSANVRPTATPAPCIPVARSKPVVLRELPRLQLSPTAAFTLSSASRWLPSLLPRFEFLGRALQVESSARVDKREVVLGLDFGTSCAKAVFGDSALGKSFGVPFTDGEGIQRYLLPSALFQTGESFSLDGGTHVHADLKLSLLASPDDPMLRMRAIAFLALAIRRARGWLLTEQEPVYRRTEIYWRLTIGLPAAQHLRSPFSDLFKVLAQAAWVASVAEGPVTQTLIADAVAVASGGEVSADVEVTVVPEIAAQIYGFVVSNAFDRDAPNLYLMADVGAGTVDSSMFRVKQARRGRWDFEFFTSLVEPNGASNLHRYRSRWWSDALVACHAPEVLRQDLEDARLQTDIGLRVPESFTDYFTGIQMRLFGAERTPDGEFFERVATQVQGKTFWRAWRDQLLPQGSLTGIPFFLCGGAGRMGYYQRLETELQSIRGCSWLKAEPYTMAVPNELEAPGMADQDYDRLSVAYGLSRLEVGKVIQALPMSKLESAQASSWRENYVDKDLC